jgi:voltage-gated potassium channel Kch
MQPAGMPAPLPTVIIVGGDALALSAARDICLLNDHRVVVLWSADAEFAAAAEACGARCLAARPDSPEGLIAAGVAEAVSILALARDEQLNLQVALRARDANPKIRIVLRQFNRTLAAKIEQNLPNCSVLSLAWHSAATYAAAALDPSCFRGLQFPEPDGPLTGFAAGTAERFGIAGRGGADAEVALGLRIVAVDGNTDLGPDAVISPAARLVVYGAVERLLAATPQPPISRKRLRAPPLRAALHRWRRVLRRRNPYVAGFAATAVVLFAIATWHFRLSLRSTWLIAAYFVMSTMTTTGYGDIIPNRDDPVDIAMAMLLMLIGTLITGIFIAFVAARLTRVQWVRMQGLRPVRRRGHIVVCGCGSIGAGVIDLLRDFGKPIVVVERSPDAALVERALDRGFDLLTGDASRDDTLDLCNLDAAHSLVALTNVDTLNLEIALGARARNPGLPIVLRIAEANFATSIASHFQFETTFSVAALAGPAFAGLSRLPGARGRIAFAGEEFAIAEFALPAAVDGVLPRLALPLAAAGKDGDFALVRDFAGLPAGTLVLVLVPLAPFHAGTESLLGMTERVLGS